MNDTTNAAALGAKDSAATSLPTAYAPVEVEGELYERWVERGYFTADAASDKPPFTIVIPPPNVTGSLHLGHALQHTLMDALDPPEADAGLRGALAAGHGPRRHRHPERGRAAARRGRPLPPRPGPRGLRREGLGVEGATTAAGSSARCGAWATACDWSRERFTMDAGLSQAVQTIFKTLYDDGPDLPRRAHHQLVPALPDRALGHRGRPRDEAAASWSRSATARATSSIVVATTRAETMLGDTAVAVHPDDERYAASGRHEVALPLTDRPHPDHRRRPTWTRSSAPAR